MYQVLDDGLIRTVMDEFRKLYCAEATSVSSYLTPFALICIKTADSKCSGLKIHYYYLWGEKYKAINVWRKRQGGHWVLLQSFSDIEGKSLLAIVDILPVQSSARTCIHNAILFNDTSNNA